MDKKINLELLKILINNNNIIDNSEVAIKIKQAHSHFGIPNRKIVSIKEYGRGESLIGLSFLLDSGSEFKECFNIDGLLNIIKRPFKIYMVREK